MIGVLVAAHGNFGVELVKGVEMIAGGYDKLAALALREGDDPEGFFAGMKEKIDELDDGDGVLVLVDLFGGSPCNGAASCLKDKNIEVVTGVNSPMLIQVLEDRGRSNLLELSKIAIATIMNSTFSVREKLSC